MSKQINITFPDGNVRTYDAGTTAMEIALSISEGLARNVLSAKVNGEVTDASRPIDEDSDVQLLTWKDDAGKNRDMRRKWRRRRRGRGRKRARLTHLWTAYLIKKHTQQKTIIHQLYH